MGVFSHRSPGAEFLLSLEILAIRRILDKLHATFAISRGWLPRITRNLKVNKKIHGTIGLITNRTSESGPRVVWPTRTLIMQRLQTAPSDINNADAEGRFHVLKSSCVLGGVVFLWQLYCSLYRISWHRPYHVPVYNGRVHRELWIKMYILYYVHASYL